MSTHVVADVRTADPLGVNVMPLVERLCLGRLQTVGFLVRTSGRSWAVSGQAAAGQRKSESCRWVPGELGLPSANSTFCCNLKLRKMQ
jgi:hypothetical protein